MEIIIIHWQLLACIVMIPVFPSYSGISLNCIRHSLKLKSISTLIQTGTQISDEAVRKNVAQTL